MSCTSVSPSGLGAVISSATSLAASSNYNKIQYYVNTNFFALINLPGVSYQMVAFEACGPTSHQN